MEPTAHMIFLRSDSLLLSKKPYSDWREIQDEYEDYMTSLGPKTENEIVEYFAIDYGEDDQRWPFRKVEIEHFFKSDVMVVERK
jgi:hypothetical protein